MSRYLYAVFLGLIVVAGLGIWLPEMYQRWEIHQAAKVPPIPTFPVLDPAAYPLPRSSLTCFAAPEPGATAQSDKDINPMPTNSSQSQAPAEPPRLKTLAILSVGLSLDVFRQGQVWDALQKQDAAQPEGDLPERGHKRGSAVAPHRPGRADYADFRHAGEEAKGQSIRCQSPSTDREQRTAIRQDSRATDGRASSGTTGHQACCAARSVRGGARTAPPR